MAIPTRYKLPATEQEARRMLAQCYLGELYKRGSLPVPPALRPPEGTGEGTLRSERSGVFTAKATARPAGPEHPGSGPNTGAERIIAPGGADTAGAHDPRKRIAQPDSPNTGGGRLDGPGGAEAGTGPIREEPIGKECIAPGGATTEAAASEPAGPHAGTGTADWFPDPATAARIAKAARWLTGDHRPGLLLYGTVGSGKSTLARAICELIGILHDSPLRSQRLAVARTSAPELVELKTPPNARTAADSEELFARLRSAPMLLIDDLGVEATAVRSWGNCLTPVIDLLYYRYDRRLFTIVTTNLDGPAIEATYGVRIADRMAELFDRIGHTGPSYRR